MTFRSLRRWAVRLLTAVSLVGGPGDSRAQERREHRADENRSPAAERSAHWSFRPVVRPALPPVKDAAWGAGELSVRAGGRSFHCAVGLDGSVEFVNR